MPAAPAVPAASPAAAHQPVRVVVADPHPTVRRALRALLEAEPWITLIDDVADLGAAGAQARRYAADVVVVDARLFAGDRSRLGPLPASTDLIVAGMDDHPDMAEYVRGRGGSAYVLKDEAHLRLCESLRALRAPLR